VSASDAKLIELLQVSV